MARFLGGLNYEIANQLELQQYMELEEMLHVAIKLENQFKRRGISTRFGGVSNSGRFNPSAWRSNPTYDNKPKPKVGEESSNRPKRESKTESVQALKYEGKSDPKSSRTRDIVCFKCQGRGHIASQCPNRRIMVLKGNGELESESEESEDAAEQEEEELEEEAETLNVPHAELSLVSRRVLTVYKGEEQLQRENIFHTRCEIQGKICSMIIDSGSCANVISNIVVDKLGLPTTKHLEPYRLQ